MSRPRYRVPCPQCGAPAGKSCRTMTGTKRVTDTHLGRAAAETDWFMEQLAREQAKR